MSLGVLLAGGPHDPQGPGEVGGGAVEAVPGCVDGAQGGVDPVGVLFLDAVLPALDDCFQPQEEREGLLLLPHLTVYHTQDIHQLDLLLLLAAGLQRPLVVVGPQHPVLLHHLYLPDQFCARPHQRPPAPLPRLVVGDLAVPERLPQPTQLAVAPGDVVVEEGEGGVGGGEAGECSHELVYGCLPLPLLTEGHSSQEMPLLPLRASRVFALAVGEGGQLGLVEAGEGVGEAEHGVGAVGGLLAVHASPGTVAHGLLLIIIAYCHNCPFIIKIIAMSAGVIVINQIKLSIMSRATAEEKGRGGCQSTHEELCEEDYLEEVKGVLSRVLGQLGREEREREGALEGALQENRELRSENYSLRVRVEQCERQAKRLDIKLTLLNNQLFHLNKLLAEKQAIIKYLEGKAESLHRTAQPLLDASLDDYSRTYSKTSLSFAKLKTPALKFEDYANHSLHMEEDSHQKQRHQRQRPNRTKTEANDSKENEKVGNQCPKLQEFFKGRLEQERTLTKGGSKENVMVWSSLGQKKIMNLSKYISSKELACRK